MFHLSLLEVPIPGLLGLQRPIGIKLRVSLSSLQVTHFNVDLARQDSARSALSLAILICEGDLLMLPLILGVHIRDALLPAHSQLADKGCRLDALPLGSLDHEELN